jgi:hypothetical protein
LKALFISNLTNMKLAFLPVLFFLPPSILAAIGGPFSNSFDDMGCICLDAGVCRNEWGGIAFEGYPGNWPCPYDSSNVMACYVSPCPMIGGGTGCTWGARCPGLVMPGKNALLTKEKSPYFTYTT